MMNVMFLVYIWLKFRIHSWPKDIQLKRSQLWFTLGKNSKLFYLIIKPYNSFFFIKTRNGNPLLFEGDLQNEESVLEWLVDDDNRELADEIEEVNERMLERLMHESPLLVVFFSKLTKKKQF